jgi:hypothetical protein
MSSNFFKRKKKLIGMPAYMQLSAIRKAFPDTLVLSKGWNNFEIELNLQPSPLSETYRIKLVYDKNLIIKVYVIGKTLKIAPNRNKLPHVYSSKEQQLCLYSPSKKEWKSTKYIVNSIIPWASEWLFYYELWLPNGEWYGGGHNEYPNEKSSKILKNE